MRRILLAILIFILPLAFLWTRIHHKDGPEATIVKMINDLPSDKYEREEILGQYLDNTLSSKKFRRGYGEADWKKNYTAFADALLKQATTQGMDSASLRRVLDEILKTAEDKTAYLPVEAYQTKLEGNQVWMIAVRNGHANFDDKALGHGQVLLYDPKTLKLVDYCTCF